MRGRSKRPNYPQRPLVSSKFVFFGLGVLPGAEEPKCVGSHFWVTERQVLALTTTPLTQMMRLIELVGQAHQKAQ